MKQVNNDTTLSTVSSKYENRRAKSLILTYYHNLEQYSPDINHRQTCKVYVACELQMLFFVKVSEIDFIDCS